MNKNKWKTLLWSFLVAIVLIAAAAILDQGNRLFANDYFESQDFQSDFDYFVEELGSTTLLNQDLKELKKDLQVTDEQIEEHRTRYGSLSDQLSSIEEQYNIRINDAEGNETVKQALIKERDTKLADIQQNFESDEHVREKVTKEQEKAIDEYVRQLNDRQVELKGYKGYFVYDLTNIETGETFSNGDVTQKAVFSKTYSEKNGYLKASNEFYREYLKEEPILKSSGFYEGTIIIPSSMKNEDSFASYQDFKHQQVMFYSTLAVATASLLSLLFLIKFQPSWFGSSIIRSRYEAWPLDVRLLIFGITGFFIILYTVMSTDVFWYKLQPLIKELLLILGLLTISIWIGLHQFMWLHNEYQEKGRFYRKLKDGMVVRFLSLVRDVFLKVPVGLQVVWVLIVFFFWGIGTVLVTMTPEAIGLYLVCVLFVGLPTLVFVVMRVAYLNRVMVATEQVSSGVLREAVPVKGKSFIAKHATHLNTLREGMKTSLSEQAKSERLKTELITNVSHDLRTPLTSIITYTDLLKKSNLTEEERQSYVEILERKSQRLKTLIEDLFEVSKMASGNIELTKQRLDLNQLLQQALAEHAEEIENAQLDFRITKYEEPIFAYVDGQKWWRVLDNLVINAIKYALPNTRVYVSLKKEGDEAVFVIKNIARYELGDDADELVERFKRADTSRHTEGSGLGLAIAQSIVDLHGGRLVVDVDGDLFKVTVSIEKSG
ncbi:HAMP domain-containing sensor histidine kinase [Bacillus sp. CGMCC 1.16541]|uniref:sensor histidine kinase n=1 Tax=Bacillus sp. CGMCC 1.16541 TaxID=2185143 RepID=UPI000D73D570|nr:HAMP domain-containing sensor histidine kinase [Bacillus sp. CGMCC 1.16541]